MLEKIGAVIIGFIVNAAKGVVDFFAHKREVSKQADTSLQPLKDAKTKEEIDAATDSALDGF